MLHFRRLFRISKHLTHDYSYAIEVLPNRSQQDQWIFHATFRANCMAIGSAPICSHLRHTSNGYFMCTRAFVFVAFQWKIYSIFEAMLWFQIENQCFAHRLDWIQTRRKNRRSSIHTFLYHTHIARQYTLHERTIDRDGATEAEADTPNTTTTKTWRP